MTLLVAERFGTSSLLITCGRTTQQPHHQSQNNNLQLATAGQQWSAYDQPDYVNATPVAQKMAIGPAPTQQPTSNASSGHLGGLSTSKFAPKNYHTAAKGQYWGPQNGAERHSNTLEAEQTNTSPEALRQPASSTSSPRPRGLSTSIYAQPIRQTAATARDWTMGHGTEWYGNAPEAEQMNKRPVATQQPTSNTSSGRPRGLSTSIYASEWARQGSGGFFTEEL
jgi:hypothetical protein